MENKETIIEIQGIEEKTAKSGKVYHSVSTQFGKMNVFEDDIVKKLKERHGARSQTQGLFPMAGERETARYRAVQGGQGDGKRADRRGPGGLSLQEAGGASRRGQEWGLSNAVVGTNRQPIHLPAWFHQERQDEHHTGRTEGFEVCRQAVSGPVHPGLVGGLAVRRFVGGAL